MKTFNAYLHCLSTLVPCQCPAKGYKTAAAIGILSLPFPPPSSELYMTFVVQVSSASGCCSLHRTHLPPPMHCVGDGQWQFADSCLYKVKAGLWSVTCSKE